jgi:hypothetical protein
MPSGDQRTERTFSSIERNATDSSFSESILLFSGSDIDMDD